VSFPKAPILRTPSPPSFLADNYHAEVPDAPEPVSVIGVRPGRLVIIWSYIGGIESGFVLERSADPESEPWEEIATIAPGHRQYTDTDSVPGQRFHYRVRAYNGNGQSPFTEPASGRSPLPSGTVSPPKDHLRTYVRITQGEVVPGGYYNFAYDGIGNRTRAFRQRDGVRS